MFLAVPRLAAEERLTVERTEVEVVVDASEETIVLVGVLVRMAFTVVTVEIFCGVLAEMSGMDCLMFV